MFCDANAASRARIVAGNCSHYCVVCLFLYIWDVLSALYAKRNSSIVFCKISVL